MTLCQVCKLASWKDQTFIQTWKWLPGFILWPHHHCTAGPGSCQWRCYQAKSWSLLGQPAILLGMGLIVPASPGVADLYCTDNCISVVQLCWQLYFNISAVLIEQSPDTYLASLPSHWGWGSQVPFGEVVNCVFFLYKITFIQPRIHLCSIICISVGQIHIWTGEKMHQQYRSTIATESLSSSQIWSWRRIHKCA